jgi:hypothetical protein
MAFDRHQGFTQLLEVGRIFLNLRNEFYLVFLKVVLSLYYLCNYLVVIAFPVPMRLRDDKRQFSNSYAYINRSQSSCEPTFKNRSELKKR